MKTNVFASLSAAVSGGVFGYLFGDVGFAFVALIVLVVIDFISGWIASGVEGKLSSKVGFKGIAKKVMLFLLIVVAHQIDIALGYENVIREATIWFYVFNEALSIIENAGRTGLPVPEPLKRAVEILKGKSEV